MRFLPCCDSQQHLFASTNCGWISKKVLSLPSSPCSSQEQRHLKLDSKHPAFSSAASDNPHLLMSCVLPLLDVSLHGGFRNALWPPATIYKVLPNSCFRQRGKSRGWFASSARRAVVCDCAAIVETLNHSSGNDLEILTFLIKPKQLCGRRHTHTDARFPSCWNVKASVATLMLNPLTALLT